MNYVVFSLLILLTCSQPTESSSSSSSSSDDSDSWIGEVLDFVYIMSTTFHEPDSHLVKVKNPESDWAMFIIVVIIFLIIFFVKHQPTSKKAEQEEVFFKKKTEQLIKNQSLHKSESISRLEELRIKIQQFKNSLVFNFKGEECHADVFSIYTNLNEDLLKITMDGRDKFGTWSKKGYVILNSEKQLECVLQKTYDNKEKIQGDDILIYDGKFSVKDQSFNGFWYYAKEQTRGTWSLKFTNKRKYNQQGLQ